MRLSAIVAVDTHGCIGKDNALPWRLPADLQHFKKLTLGHTLIMGRKTYDSIGRPLPGRDIIVVTRRNDSPPEGVRVAHSLEQALELARGADEIFIAGGADLYRQTMDRVQRLYLTRIEHAYDCDTFFPRVDLSHWRLVEEERHPATDTSPAFSFLTYER
jgi:dihydrofolate reductase